MPTVNLNVESQIASDITRATLITTVGTSSLKRKHYHITDAVNNTKKIAVFYRTDSAVTFWGYDVNNGQTGKYFLIQDLFIPIVEAQGAVLTYINLAAFPVTGTTNTVYIAQDTGTGYTWNGTTYVSLSGGTVFAANFAALPVTGSADTLYITTDNGNSYLWDGAQYVQTSSGTPVTAVESVTGYSVDNTDPVNPIVKAIPTAGTDAAEPVTGDVEVSSGVLFYKENGTKKIALEFNNENDLRLTYKDSSSGVDSQVILNGDSSILLFFKGIIYTSLIEITEEFIKTNSDNPSFQGVIYDADYSASYTLSTLIDLETLKKRFWTKAGTPTTSDDSSAGFIVGSLIYDTTNNVLYRCTNNTVGGADWEIPYSMLGMRRFIEVADSSATTGTTAETLVRSQLIPANTFKVGDIIRVRSRFRKSGTANTATQRIYINTSSSLSGANLVGQYVTGAANHLYWEMKREIVIKSSTVTECSPSSVSANVDDATLAAAATNLNIDWTVGQYIIFSVQNANAGDSTIQSFYNIDGDVDTM